VADYVNRLVVCYTNWCWICHNIILFIDLMAMRKGAPRRSGVGFGERESAYFQGAFSHARLGRPYWEEKVDRTTTWLIGHSTFGRHLPGTVMRLP
jgi:hypothetical protein